MHVSLLCHWASLSSTCLPQKIQPLRQNVPAARRRKGKLWSWDMRWTNQLCSWLTSMKALVPDLAMVPRWLIISLRKFLTGSANNMFATAALLSGHANSSILYSDTSCLSWSFPTNCKSVQDATGFKLISPSSLQTLSFKHPCLVSPQLLLNPQGVARSTSPSAIFGSEKVEHRMTVKREMR